MLADFRGGRGSVYDDSAFPFQLRQFRAAALAALAGPGAVI